MSDRWELHGFGNPIEPEDKRKMVIEAVRKFMPHEDKLSISLPEKLRCAITLAFQYKIGADMLLNQGMDPAKEWACRVLYHALTDLEDKGFIGTGSF